MISALRGAVILFPAVFLVAVCGSAHASETKFPRFCLSIAVDLRADLREEVSAIDLVITNASVVSIPRFPEGWGMKVQNYVDNTPTTISGGATGGVAELRAQDLKCLFEIQDSIPSIPPITVAGSVYISNGNTGRRLILHKHQIALEKIRSE